MKIGKELSSLTFVSLDERARKLEKKKQFCSLLFKLEAIELSYGI
jgi:hypothetical protein